MSALDQAIAAELPEIIEIRHDLHMYPEIMFEEKRTSEVVQRELKKAGVEFKAGLAGGTGVLGWLPATMNTGEAETVALRADMDALPIHEETGKPYASKTSGKMHACGHDGHTSILIGVARVLANMKNRPNNVLFLFQPAEEGGAGGKKMCEDGVLSGKLLGTPADIIFGLHGSTSLEVGKVATRTGPVMASTCDVEIEVHGQGGHAAAPHTGVDPIVVAAHIVTALQSIASRNVDPLDSVVVTIGMISGGTANNIIPNIVKMRGTLRTLKPETKVLGMRRINEIVEQVAAAFGASAKVVIHDGYPVVVNEGCATDRFRMVARQVFGEDLCEECMPVMGGEDFSFYGAHCPACFYFMGVKPKGMETHPNLHSPDFDFNDDALPVGMKAMISLALSS